MTFEAVSAATAGVPFISPESARCLYDHIVDTDARRVLELGIAHGTATCVIAAALEANGRGGRVTSVDLVEVASKYQPSAEAQVASLGLGAYVEIVRMATGYNWFLHDEIARRTDPQTRACAPVYDLVVVDGPKNWTIDAGAFFLADKLLVDGGWIVFDDYAWTYAEADARREATDGVTHRLLSEAERTTPHIREIFELLVMGHPRYGEFKLQPDVDWAWARKVDSAVARVRVEYAEGFGTGLLRRAGELARRLRR